MFSRGLRPALLEETGSLKGKYKMPLMVLIKATGVTHQTTCGPFQSPLSRNPSPAPGCGPVLELAARASGSLGQSKILVMRAQLECGGRQEPLESNMVCERCCFHPSRQASLSTQLVSRHRPGAQCQAGVGVGNQRLRGPEHSLSSAEEDSQQSRVM